MSAYQEIVHRRSKVHIMMYHLFNDMIAEAPEGHPIIPVLKIERESHLYMCKWYSNVIEKFLKGRW